MKERAATELPLGGQPLRERCRHYEQQLHEQANQLAEWTARLAAQREEIQRLKDTLAILKGERGRPPLKPSRLEPGKTDAALEGRESGSKQKRAGSAKRSKTAQLKIDKTEFRRAEQVPAGAVFKGSQEYVIQELEVRGSPTRYRCERWQTPDGGTVVGQFPTAVQGSPFGPTLRRYILYPYSQQHVPQPLSVDSLQEVGVDSSVGQGNRRLTENKAVFHEEQEAILRTGVAVSRYVNVDDTEARHQGKTGDCPHIGNECFAWFASTESNRRVNFLHLLRAGHTDYVLNEVARDYMTRQKMPKAQLPLLVGAHPVAEQAHGEAHVATVGLTPARHVQIAPEGAFLGRVLSHELAPDLVMLSAEAGQFPILRQALGWGHAERTIHQLLPFSAAQREAVATVRGQIGELYQDLKAYQQPPCPQQKRQLARRFATIFTAQPCVQTLNRARKRLHHNKAELLLVLDRPEVPLHDNGSEREIREDVKTRKISARTRSELGRSARDTFVSLKKTWRKLRLSFWAYRQDRLTRTQQMPPLPQLIRAAAQSP
jgi:uncharacterized coiled-coil protein SlyX